MKTEIDRHVTVAAMESQPLLIEGLRAMLASTGCYVLVESVRSLDALSHVVVTSAPRIVIIDKACGLPAIVDWLNRTRDRVPSAAVIWGNALTAADALRVLRAGARGVIRKTAGRDTLIACLDIVANGGTWMEDALFRNAARTEPSVGAGLTPREHQVLELVEQGLRNKEIAAELGIQPGTVKIHLKHIFEKTGIRGRFGLALSGLRDRVELAEFHA